MIVMMTAMRIDLIDPVDEAQEARGCPFSSSYIARLERSKSDVCRSAWVRRVRVVDEPRRQEKTRSRGFKGSESKVGDDGDDRN